MTIINKKLILILSILAFVFGISFTHTAYGSTFTADTGTAYSTHSNGNNNNYAQQTYSPQNNNYPAQYTTYYTNNNGIATTNTPQVIDGCSTRNTGFSTTTGQSCAGNYISPTTIAISQTAKKSASSTNTKTPAKTGASDLNTNYGSLGANALFGSNSFMPTGILQWIFFVLIILLIIYLWRYIHRSEEKYHSTPMKHA